MATAGDQPARPAPGALFWASFIWAVIGATFVVLAVLAKYYDYFPSDVFIAHRIQRIDVPAFGGYVDFVNFLGRDIFYIALTLVLAGAFALLRAPIEAFLVFLTIGPRVLNSAAKEAVTRPRPSADLIHVTQHDSGYSFPSGHTVGTAALFGVLFFVIPAVIANRPVRWLLQLACLLLVVSAGPARVYVGVHWPSDTLASYLLALMFLIPAGVGYRLLRGNKEA
jgi:membrane-associated phospholipid phosphatase